MAFAYVVRETMRDPATRPEAVAVELGPQAAAILASWLRALEPARRLPCMLGLLRRNRLIHPNYRNECLALQERYGLPLHRISPTELIRSCGFSPTSLICLSPVDSIIEAIRSAVEYGLEIYGIDLEESAGGNRGQALLEDPAAVAKDIAVARNLTAYVGRNANRCASSCRDEYVDDRREWHMAAQLRFLATKYSRVLFTGGLAHWQPLQRLLLSNDPPAMEPPSVIDDRRYNKVVVDPNLAISQMDIMPNYASEYEGWRMQPDKPLRFPSPVEFLRRACCDAVATSGGELPDAQTTIARYFAYLENLLLLRLRNTIDFVSALEAAAAIISPQMACSLQRTIFHNAGIDWLREDSMVGYPYLQALAIEQDERFLVEHCSKVRLAQGEDKGSPFLVDYASDDDLSSTRHALCLSAGPHDKSLVEKRETSSDEPGARGFGITSGPWIWPPCEALFFGTAYRLRREVHRQRRGHGSEPFGGSLQAGIDVKGTLRSFARGNSEIQVYVERGVREPTDKELQQPFVYVLQSPQDHRSPSGLGWELLRAGDQTEEQFLGSAALHFREVTERFGDRFISTILYGEARGKPPEARDSPNVLGYRLIWGAVSFGNPVLNARQGAQWLSGTDFNCCPILRSSTMSELFEHYRREFGIDLDACDWPDILVRLAIPFATERRVLVVGPDRRIITQQAQVEARRRGVHLDFVSLSYLSAQLVREIQTQWEASPVDRDATEWPSDVIRYLGPADAHFELLPPSIRRQAFPNG
jgi:hypothetical protein